MLGEVLVIGFGQPVAGDDGVGIAVVRELSQKPWAKSVEIREMTDPLRLIDLFDSGQRMILVDGIVGKNISGTVLSINSADLADGKVNPVSSHGVNVAQVIELAQVVAEDNSFPEIQIVGITIKPPVRFTDQMSPEVTAAIPKAVMKIRTLLEV